MLVELGSFDVIIGMDWTTFRNWNFLVCPHKLVWRILETMVDKFMIRFGVNVSFDSGFPLNAYENFLIYKERTKKLHDSKIKNRIFNVGDQVLLFNSRLKIFSGKLKTRWSGPFTITECVDTKCVMPSGFETDLVDLSKRGKG
nr:reverse transcriptase domain-containing protein [Tanacetum cinerariifolium]